MWASALTGRQGSCIDHPGQRRTAKRMRCGREGWAGIGAEIIPKVPSNAGQSLSHGEAVTAPFAQGSLGNGGCGSPRRFAPRNDSPDPLSFRGGPTGRRAWGVATANQTPPAFGWRWLWESVLFTMDRERWGQELFLLRWQNSRPRSRRARVTRRRTKPTGSCFASVRIE